MSTQITGKVAVTVGATPHSFRLLNMPGVTWDIREEDRGRIEVNDVVTIEIAAEVFGRPGFEKDISEEDRKGYRLVRISKGGDPAFQG